MTTLAAAAIFMSSEDTPDSFSSGLDVLNCEKGHIRIDFDRNDPEDVDRAKSMIMDMLARGYLLMAEEADGAVSRVLTFDPDKERYVVQDGPRKGKKGRKKGVPMKAARTTAVGRTAGG